MIRGLREQPVLNAVGAAVALGVWVIAWPVVEDALFPPRCYDKVEVQRLWVDSDDHLHIWANFRKIGCTIRRVDAVVSSNGVMDLVPWRDSDGLDPDHNRSAGAHTLRLSVYIDHLNYDWIEIRTLHDDAGRNVSGTFLRIDEPEQYRENPIGGPP